MHYKQNNKESKTYVQGLRSFGNTLPRGIKNILKKNGYNYSEILSKWNMLVGDNISNYSYPKSVKMSKSEKNGTLVLMVKRGNEITIEYSKQDIINKINSYFGYKLINEIKLQTFNSENKKIKNNKIPKKLLKDFEKKINEVKNTEIRSSLLELYNNMKKND